MKMNCKASLKINIADCALENENHFASGRTRLQSDAQTITSSSIFFTDVNGMFPSNILISLSLTA